MGKRYEVDEHYGLDETTAKSRFVARMMMMKIVMRSHLMMLVMLQQMMLVPTQNIHHGLE
jgi:hypothetical protein